MARKVRGVNKLAWLESRIDRKVDGRTDAPIATGITGIDMTSGIVSRCPTASPNVRVQNAATGIPAAHRPRSSSYLLARQIGSAAQILPAMAAHRLAPFQAEPKKPHFVGGCACVKQRGIQPMALQRKTFDRNFSGTVVANGCGQNRQSRKVIINFHVKTSDRFAAVCSGHFDVFSELSKFSLGL